MHLLINYQDMNAIINKQNDDLNNINYYIKSPIIGRSLIFEDESNELKKLDFNFNYDIKTPTDFTNNPDIKYFIMVFNEQIKVFNGTIHSIEKSFCLVKEIQKDKYKILSTDNNIYKPNEEYIFRVKNNFRYFIPLKFN